MNQAPPPPYLTPSEHVLLNGEKFAPKAGVFNRFALLHMDFQVNITALVQSMLAAALLINEQQGSVRLDVRPKPAMLGLMKQDAVFVTPLAQLAWPQNTAEAGLTYIATYLAPQGKNDVYSIVYEWLGGDDDSPFNKVIENVKWGMACRGLLQVQEKRSMKIFVSRSYTLPDATRSIAYYQPIQPLQQAISNCQAYRPQVWKLLNESIEKAVKARIIKKNEDAFSPD